MPYLSSEALTDFSCKRDLIASLLTSCHIPLYFDSYIETFFRKGLYMDGAWYCACSQYSEAVIIL